MDPHKGSFGKRLPGLALYGAALLLVVGACFVLWEKPEEAPLGNLEGRFDSEITYPYEDATLHYREATLTNLLLIGVDREEEAPLEAPSQEGGQADFLLLVTADRESRAITLTHIDRDTITEIGTYGIFGNQAGSMNTQICLSHAFGTTEAQRCENTVQAVEKLFGGIVIDGYLAMDIDDITALNDALGGVTVTLEDDFSSVDSTMQPGRTLTLTGKQAEIYVCYRSILSDSTNQNRMKRQRAYMRGAMEILKSGDSTFSEDLLETMGERIYTDLTENTLADLLSRWKNYETGEIQGLHGTHTMGEDGFVAFDLDEEWMAQYLAEHFFQETFANRREIG